MSSRFLQFYKHNTVSLGLGLIAIISYFYLAQHLKRTDFIILISLSTLLFLTCYRLISFKTLNFKLLIVFGILFRLLFINTIPNLSQDFYRFIWDGQLVGHFLNPYIEVPNNLIKQSNLVIANAQELYNGMGELSARHYSNYPPLNQLIFAISTTLGNNTIIGSVFFMRLFIILADLGILYYGRKLLIKLNRNPKYIFWYFLNPLVIFELTGNLHFEGVMLFFFVWSLYLLSIKKYRLAAIPYALSIAVKLVPILFLPLFLKHLGFKKSCLFYTIIGLTCIALLIPFYSDVFFANYSNSVGLWFSNFEFNAGLYNAIKTIAAHFDVKPWQLIKTYGKITPILVIITALLLTFIGKNKSLQNMLNNMLWLLTLYYLLTTTVHPWYIIFLVILSVCTQYRFAILWSAMVILSYYAYSNPDFKENLTLLLVEYFVIISCIIYELFTKKADMKINPQK